VSVPQQAKPAKLFVSVIARQAEDIARVVLDLADRYGPIDFVSEILPFDLTDYYEAEMGRPLLRRFASYGTLIGQDDLVQIKEQTNMMETRSSRQGRRTVNIDPGYLVAERLVLASGKNYTHRIYLGRGIYADLTLIFQRQQYRALPWTYPDYAQQKIRDWLWTIRQRYLFQLRQGEKMVSPRD